MNDRRYIFYSDLLVMIFATVFILSITAIVALNVIQHGENVKRDNAVLEGLLAPYRHCQVVSSSPDNYARDTRVVLRCSAAWSDQKQE